MNKWNQNVNSEKNPSAATPQKVTQTLKGTPNSGGGKETAGSCDSKDLGQSY